MKKRQRARYERKLCLESMEARRVLATYTVNDAGDLPDADLEDGLCADTVGKCTLRAALMNAERDSALDTIEFAIGGSSMTEIPSIATSGLAVRNGPVRILGNTQPGSERVELVGSGNFGNGILLGVGLQGSSRGSEVRGLIIHGFETGIQSRSGNNWIVGNWIGTNAAGDAAPGNVWGITVDGGSTTIGGSADSDANVIVGSQKAAIALGGENDVLGNLIGLDPTGMIALGNLGDGIIVSGSQSTVGGAKGNWIAASGGHGIYVANQFEGIGNELFANKLGVNILGDALPSFGNAGHGIYIGGGDNNSVGGINQPNIIMHSGLSGISLFQGSSENNLTGNVIGLSKEHGIHIDGNASVDNILRANFVGSDATGEQALPNEGHGIYLVNVPNTRIESGLDGPNIIVANKGDGIRITDGYAFEDRQTVIRDAKIGVTPSGSALGNGGNGIFVEQNQSSRATRVTIGPGNTISANEERGIRLTGGSFSHLVASDNQIFGNWIGTDSTGQFDRGNGAGGVLIENIRSNTIGGQSNAEKNIISGNRGPGVELRGPRSQANQVVGSWIGTANPLGAVALPNWGPGVLIHESASQNLIGGPLSGPRTVISANLGHGIQLENGAHNNTILGTFIGTDHSGAPVIIDGEHILGNAGDGVFVNDVASTRIGGTLENTTGLQFNVIAGNRDSGVRIEGADASATVVQGNLIGATFVGEQPLGNGMDGVLIQNGAHGNLIGGIATSLQQGNTIVHNQGNGVTVDAASENAILRNKLLGNAGLGIDLGSDGVTDNDALDIDSGSNQLQNFPLLTAVNDRVAQGTFLGGANSRYRIELFTTEEQDPSMHGEGTYYLGCTEIMTDAEGNATIEIGFGGRNNSDLEFCSQEISVPPKAVDFTATATHINSGNTSEFSPIYTGLDLSIVEISALSSEVFHNGADLILPVQVTVRNDGYDSLTDVLVELETSSNVADTETWPQLADLPARSTHTVVFPLVVSDDLDLGQGQVDYSFRGTIDTLDRYPETVETNNTSLNPTLLSLDSRPKIASLRSEHALPATFLSGFDLMNRIDIFVEDWNGNLPDSLVGDDASVVAELMLNGVPFANPFGTVSINPAEPNFKRTFNTGDDLHLGTNTVEASVSLLGSTWKSPSESIELRQVDPAFWLTEAFSAVDTTGARYSRISEYRGGFQFPDVAVEGFFDLPVEKVSFLEGVFGSRLQLRVQPSFRTDGKGSISGSAEYSVQIGDKETIGGSEGKATASVTGDFQIDASNKIRIESLSAGLRSEIRFHSSKAPIFPTPPIFASGFVGGGLDTTIYLTEDEEEALAFDNVTVGLDGIVGGSLLAGVPKIAFLEGTVAGQLRGQFQLPPDPTYNARADAILAAQAVIRLLTFEVRSPKAEFTCTIFGNGTCFDGDGEAFSSTNTRDQFQLAPREDWQLPEGQDSDGLPLLNYAYAVPSLAVHADGTRTLVYVGDDPAKANGQQLEIYAAKFDGSAWQPPVALTNDTMLDDRPSVTYSSDGTVIAVWSRVKNTIENPSTAQPEDFLPGMEIYYSILRPGEPAWSEPAALTDNASLDFLPELRADENGNVVAMWKRATDNSIPIVGDESVSLDSETLTSIWSGQSWSTPTVVTSTANVERPVFQTDDQKSYLVWAEDGDSNGLTRSDSSIQLISSTEDGGWSSPQTLVAASAGIQNHSPRMFRDVQSQLSVAWVRSQVEAESSANRTDQLWIRSQDLAGWGTPEVAVEASVINDPQLVVDSQNHLYAVWQGQGDQGLDLFYSVRDSATGKWGPTFNMTESPDADWSFQAFINGADQLEILYVAREIESNADSGGEGEDGPPSPPGFGPSVLLSQTVSIGPDLQILDVLVSDHLDALPAPHIDINVGIHNSGSFAAPTSTLHITNESTNSVLDTLVVPAISAGASLSIPWQIPASDAHQLSTLLFTVDPAADIPETDENNNDMLLNLELPGIFELELPEPGTALVDTIGNDLRVSLDGVPVFQHSADSIQTLRILGSVENDRFHVSTIRPTFAGLLQIDGGSGVDSVVHQSQDSLSLLSIGYTRVEELEIQDSPNQAIFVGLGGLQRLDADSQTLRIVTNDDQVSLLGSDWSVDEPQAREGRFAHTLLLGSKTVLLENDRPYHNPLSPLDANRDGFVTPIDALLVINAINSGRQNSLTELPTDLGNHAYIDINNDLFLSAIDALLVINHLNQRAGEGEHGGLVSHEKRRDQAFAEWD